MLLWFPDDAERLVNTLKGARRVVIGTAILGGGPGAAVLAGIAGSVPVLVVTGCGGGLTRRDAIEHLRNAGAEVLVVDDRVGGLFHPKVFATVRADGRATMFVGSANLSGGGLSANTEAVYQADARVADVDALEARLRSQGPLLTNLDDLPSPPPTSGKFKPALTKPIPLSEVLNLDWDGYVEAVRAMDGWWRSRGHDVFDRGGVGWLPTIGALRDDAQGGLASLSAIGRKTLVGKRPGDDVAYFGDFNATPARDIILHPAKHASSANVIDAARSAVGTTGGPITLAQAVNAFDSLTAISGVWLGVASRILLSVRPDVFVSVNDGSRDRLREQTGLVLPVQGPPSRRCPAYKDLLARVMDAPWWDVPCPATGDGRIIWAARAALLDIFVYKSLGDS